MKRFILLTFGFLGWAFYEMSDGSDFESASDRVARLQPAPEVVVTPVEEITPATETETAQVAPTAPVIVDTDPPEVSRVSVNLTTLQSAAEQARNTVTVDPVSGVAVNVGITTSSADTPAIIPSLIAPNDTGTVTPSAPHLSANVGDIRTVSGNRVNVRGGPGTDFGVVTRLERGDAVEVIQDNGDGWVLMRPLDGGAEGWMADFLLTSG